MGAWSRSSFWEMLRNPKCTGHQVRNRRARKKGHNRENPPEAWIWSEQAAHPALVTFLATPLDAALQGELRALFDALQLDVVFQPVDSAVDVAATLYYLSSETAQSAAPRSAEDWSAPPAGNHADGKRPGRQFRGKY